MRLFEKAKKYSIWHPSEIDFVQDRQDWAGLSEDEQDLILCLTALFQTGEEVVTLNLLRRMVDAGYLGRKTGKGFYDYE